EQRAELLERTRMSRDVSLPPFLPEYRASGLLLHVTSLPSRYGIGDVGPAALGLVATPNGDLSDVVGEQKFRSDLFYRLSVFPIRVPALWERAEDIRLLVRYFVQHFAKRMNNVIDTISSE